MEIIFCCSQRPLYWKIFASLLLPFAAFLTMIKVTSRKQTSNLFFNPRSPCSIRSHTQTTSSTHKSNYYTVGKMEPYNHFHKLEAPFVYYIRTSFVWKERWMMIICVFPYPLWVFYTNLWYMFNHPFDTLLFYLMLQSRHFVADAYL